MRRMFERGSVVTAGLAAMLVLGSTGALAHECYNASRSDKGDQQAGTKSQAWYQVNFAEEFTWGVDEGLWTQEQADCAYDHWLDNGGMESFTVKVKGTNGQDGTIAANNPNSERMHDGRGIDHLDEGLFGLYLESFETCGVELPDFEE